MSRLEFRSAVDLPRPRGAIAMVAAASATLAVTGQVAAWVVALQTAAIVAALALRRRPLAIQRSGLALNLGLAGAVAAGIAHHTRGEPSTIALAHFAMLAQGLQLLDARPRRSEFLLVAMALFQVILASNLTDTLAFPFLLVAFLLATVWTLLVHTLRLEALEAGDLAAAQRAATPGLLRTTLLVSCGSVLLAGLLFLLLPRMHAAMMRAVGGAAAVSGLSDRVELGDIGRIRADRTLALRVETLRGDPPPPSQAYWRGLAFDTFDGRSWSVTRPRRRSLPGTPRLGVPLRGGAEPPDLVQRIVREPVERGVIFGMAAERRFQGPVETLERDTEGNLYAPRSDRARLQYTIASRLREPDPEQLATDAARPPSGSGDRYRALPPLSDTVREQALRITAGAETDAARAAALERHLRRAGRYTDAPPDLGSDDRSPVEAFLLGDLAGHCEYFATGMAVMARSIGLPARIVTGFAGGRRNRVGGFIELAHSDAHAWVEIHFERAGWVHFDPTPPDLRLRTAAGGSLVERIAEIASAVELWWFRRVVDFDRTTQMHALRSGWLAWRSFRARSSASPEAADTTDRALPDLDPPLVLLAAGLAAALYLALRRRPGRQQPPVSTAYTAALRLLQRRGHTRPASTTARAFARQIAPALPPSGAAAFTRLTESHLAARYGRHPASTAPRDLTTLRHALRQER